MWPFDDPKPRVSKIEFQKLRSTLSSKGFSHEKLDRLQTIFDASLGGATESQMGIDAGEISRTMSSLRAHPDSKLFTPSELDAIEAHLKTKL